MDVQHRVVKTGSFLQSLKNFCRTSDLVNPLLLDCLELFPDSSLLARNVSLEMDRDWGSDPVGDGGAMAVMLSRTGVGGDGGDGSRVSVVVDREEGELDESGCEAAGGEDFAALAAWSTSRFPFNAANARCLFSFSLNSSSSSTSESESEPYFESESIAGDFPRGWSVRLGGATFFWVLDFNLGPAAFPTLGFPFGCLATVLFG